MRFANWRGAARMTVSYVSTNSVVDWEEEEEEVEVTL